MTTKCLKKRKWNDAYFSTVYEHAKDGLTDEEIAQQLDVPLHTLRRWIRNNDALNAVVGAARGALEQAKAQDAKVAEEGSNEGDDLQSIYKEFSHLKPPMKKRLLICYAQTGILTHAARAAGTSRENHYRWMKDDPEYAELFERIHPLTVGRLEDQALTHAMYGMRRYKFNQSGRPIMVRCDATHPDAVYREDENGNTWHERHYYEDEFSPSLQIFMLKCWKPDRYRDKPIELSTNVTVGFDLNQVLQHAEHTNVIDVDTIEAKALEYIKEHEDE